MSQAFVTGVASWSIESRLRLGFNASPVKRGIAASLVDVAGSLQTRPAHRGCCATLAGRQAVMDCWLTSVAETTCSRGSYEVESSQHYAHPDTPSGFRAEGSPIACSTPESWAARGRFLGVELDVARTAEDCRPHPSTIRGLLRDAGGVEASAAAGERSTRLRTRLPASGDKTSCAPASPAPLAVAEEGLPSSGETGGGFHGEPGAQRKRRRAWRSCWRRRRSSDDGGAAEVSSADASSGSVRSVPPCCGGREPPTPLPNAAAATVASAPVTATLPVPPVLEASAWSHNWGSGCCMTPMGRVAAEHPPVASHPSSIATTHAPMRPLAGFEASVATPLPGTGALLHRGGTHAAPSERPRKAGSSRDRGESPAAGTASSGLVPTTGLPRVGAAAGGFSKRLAASALLLLLLLLLLQPRGRASEAPSSLQLAWASTLLT